MRSEWPTNRGRTHQFYADLSVSSDSIMEERELNSGYWNWGFKFFAFTRVCISSRKSWLFLNRFAEYIRLYWLSWNICVAVFYSRVQNAPTLKHKWQTSCDLTSTYEPTLYINLCGGDFRAIRPLNFAHVFVWSSRICIGSFIYHTLKRPMNCDSYYPNEKQSDQFISPWWWWAHSFSLCIRVHPHGSVYLFKTVAIFRVRHAASNCF